MLKIIDLPHCESVTQEEALLYLSWPPDSQPDRFCYIYAISDGDTVKFGRASLQSGPDGRLGCLQIGNPRKLGVLGRVLASPKLEEILHKALQRTHLRGEWFQLENEAKLFIEMMNKGDVESICNHAAALIRRDDLRYLRKAQIDVWVEIVLSTWGTWYQAKE